MFPMCRTKRRLEDLKDNIYSNPRYYGPYVSYDSKKTLIMVDFFEEGMDYRYI